MFEYTLIKDLNDDFNTAIKIRNVFRKYNIKYHINVIVLNENDGISGLTSTGREYARKFTNMLDKNGISATLRRTMGQDIEGACGMLRKKFLDVEN